MQQQEKKPKRKKKSNLKFDSEKVFSTAKDTELSEILDEEVLQYKARKGEAGDRNPDK